MFAGHLAEHIQHKALDALLHAEHHRCGIKLYLADGHLPLISAVLGFDYHAGEILIDSPPEPMTPAQERTFRTAPVWLQIPFAGETLTLVCRPASLHHGLYVLRPVDARCDRNQRWFPRIHFGAHQGPELQLGLAGKAKRLRGGILDLSAHGAGVAFYGKDLRTELNDQRTCLCRLHFNEDFDITLNAEVLHLRYLRQAPRRSHLRLLFKHTDDESLVQLQNFVELLNGDGDNDLVNAA